MYFPSAVPTKIKFHFLLFDICLEHVVKMRTSHVRLCKQCSALAESRITYQSVCIYFSVFCPKHRELFGLDMVPCSCFWLGFDQWRGSSVHGISFESCTCRTVTLQQGRFIWKRYGGLGVRMYLKACCVTISILLMIWFPYLWWQWCLNHIFT